MYLISNKLASNEANIPVSYIYRTLIYAHVIHYRQNLNFSILFGLEDRKSIKDPPNRSEGVQYYPECQGFYIFFIFHALQNVGKVRFASQNDVFCL